jgi:hypothetical protein
MPTNRIARFFDRPDLPSASDYPRDWWESLSPTVREHVAHLHRTWHACGWSEHDRAWAKMLSEAIRRHWAKHQAKKGID